MKLPARHFLEVVHERQVHAAPVPALSTGMALAANSSSTTTPNRDAIGGSQPDKRRRTLRSAYPALRDIGGGCSRYLANDVRTAQ